MIVVWFFAAFGIWVAWTLGAKQTRHFLGNVEGWVQYRKLLPGEAVYCGE